MKQTNKQTERKLSMGERYADIIAEDRKPTLAEQIEVNLRAQRASLLSAARGILDLAKDPAGCKFTMAEMLNQIEGMALEQAVNEASGNMIVDVDGQKLEVV